MAANALFDAIAKALPPLDDGTYVVAFSGGVDSTVLLHVLTRLCPSGTVRAAHIQHNLQPDAPNWAKHCQDQAAELGVPIAVHSVTVATDGRHGPEAAAREARYDALQADMQPGDVLLTAHHADDQAQTFLLQALRGSGLRGLAAMPERCSFGTGWHVRPLLGSTREQIQQYAEEQALDWVNDPSNEDASVDRAYLNTHVWPLIRQHWPAAATTLSRSAHWCSQGSEQVQTDAADDLAQCADTSTDCLLLSRLTQLPQQRRFELIRYWLDTLGLPPPQLQHVQEIEANCLVSRCDAQPVVSWRGVEVRRYQDGLFAMAPLSAVDSSWSAAWTPPTSMLLPDGSKLSAEPGVGGLPQDMTYQVRLRQGGERVHLPRRAHTTSLKSALQQAGVPPWQRERLPLIIHEQVIVAVADLWICEGFSTGPNESGWLPHWSR